MNNWAKEGRFDCHFLCVCVLGDQSAYSLSKEMSLRMKLSHCVNGFIDNDQDMPTYGQLGCRGFIILDSEHRLVSPGTSAFMEVRDLAFDHVEALLDAVCAGRPPPKVCPGEYIVLEQPPPERPDLKGAQGMCVKVEGSSVHFGFMSGPLRGRMMAIPMSAVGRMAPVVDEGGCNSGKCGPGGCGPQGCADGKCGDGACADGKCGPGGCAPGSCGPGGCKSDGGCQPGAACGAEGACASGGCDGAGGCDGRGGCLDQSIIDQALDIDSVKVPSMDAEHAECARVLRELASRRTRESLEAVLQCVGGHFEHEEALFTEYGFGAHSNAKLSAANSHAEDHKRILNKIRGCLQATSDALLPGDFILELLQDFHEHTTRHDSQYAEPLFAKGAR
mmetsp:Transcript_18905/g.53876  ORF Transcript_18905/g.53876 Transcript_18905/m.53876 type:complete len:390 (-) Transcript_18905:452-1621(-)